MPGGVATMMIAYEKELILKARELRKNMTKQEKHLWYDFLSLYPVRVQRQKVIGSFIVDFYCHKAKLVIEIDGAQHYEEENKKYDIKRTQLLNEKGIEVLRFLNSEIDKNFKGVCECIDLKIKAKIHTLPPTNLTVCHLPHRGRLN